MTRLIIAFLAGALTALGIYVLAADLSWRWLGNPLVADPTTLRPAHRRLLDDDGRRC